MKSKKYFHNSMYVGSIIFEQKLQNEVHSFIRLTPTLNVRRNWCRRVNARQLFSCHLQTSHERSPHNNINIRMRLSLSIIYDLMASRGQFRGVITIIYH